MVSPCSSKKKYADVKEIAVRTSGVPKPLAKYKFYLDLKSQNVANKLQAQIQDLGGIIEFCLVKEVTCLITDKEEWLYSNRAQQGSSRQPFGSPANGSPKFAPKAGRPKNRADAMLERAGRREIICSDPFEAVRKWGISVWSVEKAFAWLSKVQIQITANKKKSKVFQLKPPYLKFEAFDRNTRPVFKEIPNWPSLYWKGFAGEPAFLCRSQVERNMTRKTRVNRNDALQQPGYCEVCRLEYTHLDKHLQSDKHQRFISDNGNFIELDALIDEEAGIESFLKIQGKMCDNEVDYLPPQTRKRLGNRTNSLCSEKVKRLPLTPTGCEFGGHRLRSRTQINYVVSTPTDEEFPVKPEGAKETRELRSSNKSTKMVEDVSDKPDSAKDTPRPRRTCTIENDQPDASLCSSGRPKRSCTMAEPFDSGRPKRSCTLSAASSDAKKCPTVDGEEESSLGRSRKLCVNKKRASADEKLVVDNRTYYKVEVINNKLRSSGVGVRENHSSKRVRSPLPIEEDARRLIIKFRKIRNSELSLNREAEKILFPSSGGDVDANGPNTTVSTGVHDSSALLSSDAEEVKKRKAEMRVEDDNSMDSNCSDSSAKKRKRRTHAEAFILDNQKYYKFETPGSRLRYQGSLIPLVSKSPQKSNGDCVKEEAVPTTTNNELEKKSPHNKESIPVDDPEFSFEQVPYSEPWYESFLRQDQGREHYFAMSGPEELRTFLLPYQLPPLPPLDPAICIAAYQLRKKIHEANMATKTDKDGTEMRNEGSKLNDAVTAEAASIDLEAELMKLIEEQKNPKKAANAKKKKKFITSPQTFARSPRKSPRKHASTLAILSSLVHHRRRKTNLNSSTSSDTKQQHQPDASEPETKATEEEPEPEYQKLADDIDRMLALEACPVDEYVEVTGDDTDISWHYEPDIVEFMESYDSQRELFSSVVRKPVRRKGKSLVVRKKKKNRTGWPTRSVKKRRREKGEADNTLDETEDSDVENYGTDVNSIRPKAKLGSDSRVTDGEERRSSSVRRGKGRPPKRQNRVKKKARRLDESEEDLVDQEKWASSEKELISPVLQPVVRVEKLDDRVAKKKKVKVKEKKSGGSSSTGRPTKGGQRQKQSSSPRSPRALRKPRGKWYKER